MGCPGGTSTIQYTHISIYARFSSQFLFKFSYKKIAMGKKDRCTVFGCRNIHWSSLFGRKACVNTERVPPGHPIILLKCKEFNKAAILVERSIPACLLKYLCAYLVWSHNQASMTQSFHTFLSSVADQISWYCQDCCPLWSCWYSQLALFPC